MTEYGEFSQKLRAFITDAAGLNDHGMLIRADALWQRRTGKQVTDAAFRLVSGTCRKEFITLWELFDERDLCRECIRRMAEVASSIRERTNYHAIASVTPTCKYLIQEMHSQIGGRVDPAAADLKLERDEVDLHYFGPHPVQSLEIEAFQDLTGQRVLIVTDVFASGSLVFDLVRAIKQLGGQLAGVLCVIMTNAPLSEKVDENGKIDLAAINRDLPDNAKFPSDLPIYCLTTYPIQDLKDGELNNERLIDIDPLTLLPEEPEAESANLPFGFAAMFRHLENAKAIGIDYYFMDQRRFIAAVRLPRLLSIEPGTDGLRGTGAEIWERIASNIKFDHQTLVVAPVTAIDIRFNDFIVDHLRASRAFGRPWKALLIPRRDTVGGSYYDYFPPPHGVELLSGRTVVLTVASVHTSEKLRNLVTILVRHNVKKITVLCLLNRMGRQTAEFIGSIQHFVRRRRIPVHCSLRPARVAQ